ARPQLAGDRRRCGGDRDRRPDAHPAVRRGRRRDRLGRGLSDHLRDVADLLLADAPGHGGDHMKKMTMIIGGVAAVVVAVAVGIVVARPDGGPARATGPSPAPLLTSPPHTPYAQAVDAAHRNGLRIWIESDLVKRWRAGPESFTSAIASITELARRPGVVGVKIADELGYHDGLDSPDK